MSVGVVHVIEDLGDDGHTCSGLWSAHWDKGRFEVTRGPEGVSAHDAIAWAREQSDIVLVSPCDVDTPYSAGRTHPPEYPAWPDGQELPRRPCDEAHAGTSDGDSRTLWRVSAGTMSEILDLDGLAVPYDASLRAHRDIEEILVSPHVSASGRLECEFTVRARSGEEARFIALEASERAFHAATTAIPRPTDRAEPALPTSIPVQSYVKKPTRCDSRPDP